MHYEKNPPLDFADLAETPEQQLDRWLNDAKESDMIEPTAMTLATATSDGKPSARMVLFKGYYQGDITFYTNYESRKGAELSENDQVALVFWWDKLERSVRIEGTVSKLPKEVSERYFHSRPRVSQIAAATSRQSQKVPTRDDLDQRLIANEKKWADGEVPLPEFWGGFAVKASRFEFWQGRRGRFHDRLVFERSETAIHGWQLFRLEP